MNLEMSGKKCCQENVKGKLDWSENARGNRGETEIVDSNAAVRSVIAEIQCIRNIKGNRKTRVTYAYGRYVLYVRKVT